MSVENEYGDLDPVWAVCACDYKCICAQSTRSIVQKCKARLRMQDVYVHARVWDEVCVEPGPSLCACGFWPELALRLACQREMSTGNQAKQRAN